MSKKHRQLREIARELFWKHGFSRVTVEEICREAGVSKMTFYKHYPNKTELVKSILEEEIDKGMAAYRNIMDDDTPYTDKVTRMIHLKLDQTRDMSNEFFKDYLNSEDPELIAFMREQSTRNIHSVVEDFRKAQEEGLLRKDIRVEFILYFLNKMLTMVQDPELDSLYETSHELIMELTNFFFYGIMGKNEGDEKKFHE